VFSSLTGTPQPPASYYRYIMLANVNNTSLYYELSGPQSGHHLVLIHGASLDTRMWDPQVEAFSRHYRVLRYDIRGYGRSVPPDPHAPFRHHDDLHALLDHLSIFQAHILGLSLGAAIALEFAFAHSPYVTSLVLAAPVLWGHQWSESVDTSNIWEAGHTRGIEAARALWLAHPLFASALRNPLAAAPLTRIVGDYSGWHWANDDPGLLPDPLAITALESITMPTLIIVGEHDLPDYRAISQTLSSRLPNCTLITLPNAGHMSNMEAPASFNTSVLTFLSHQPSNP
jgi:pimeloyl-ACP methyl ester carboxylesterase